VSQKKSYRCTLSQIKVFHCLIIINMSVCILTLLSVPAYSESLSISTVEQTSNSTASTATLPSKPVDNMTSADDSISTDYIKGIAVNTGKIIISPLHWESSDWLKAGVVAGVTGGLFFVDRTIHDFTQRNHSSVANKFATVGNDFGSPLYILPPVGAFYLYGYLSDDKKARKTTLLAVESFAITTLFTETIKVTAQRSRPNSGASPSTWNGPHLSLKNVSFCSGHASTAFSVATVFAEEYKDTWYVPPIAYGLASLTGLSRVYSNEHWASDVFFGAVLGYFVGQSVIKLHEVKATKNITVAPMVSGEYKGLAVTYKF
jgi:membrane-associated phospholipid phosphatase